MKIRAICLLALLVSGVCSTAADFIQVFIVNSGTTNIVHFGVNAGVGVGFPPYTCGSAGQTGLTAGDVPAASAKLFNVNIGGGWSYPLAGGFGPSGGTTGAWPAGITNLGPCTFTVQGPGSFFAFHVQAGGPATNCTFPINIQNNDVYPKMFALLHNAVFTGTYWLIPALGSVQDTYVVPNCDFEGYALEQVYEGTVNGTPVNLPGGAQRIDGGSTGGIGTIGGDNGLTGGTNTIGPAQLPPAASGTNQTTNGPIAYGPNSNPTNAVNNGTVQAGDNALYTATVNGDNGLLQAINQMDNDLRANTASTSNLLGQVIGHLTNGTGGSNADYSGVLNQIQSNTLGAANNTGFMTNFGQITNQLSGWFSAQLSNMQSAAQAAGSSISNAFGSALGSFPTAPSVGGGSDGVRIPTANGAPDVVLSVAELPESFDLARTVISWVIWLVTYVAMIRFAQEAVLRLLSQRQVQGSEQEVLGVNLTFPSALVYGGIAAATIAAVPTAIASYFQGTSSIVASFNQLSVLAANPLWNLMTQLVPVSVIVTAFFSYLTFRYLIAFPLIVVCATIIMFLLV